MATYTIDTQLLRDDAKNLESSKAEMYATLNDITKELNKLLEPDVWNDDVAELFMEKFNGLSDDFQNYDEVLGNYASKAVEIADEYDEANRATKQLAEELRSDI
ncbi:MAG: hypothetical protein GX640_02940 [Fibrobacter sp.]|nr:hypothetical protein [Fibrobacter sp.]